MPQEKMKPVRFYSHGSTETRKFFMFPCFRVSVAACFLRLPGEFKAMRYLPANPSTYFLNVPAAALLSLSGGMVGWIEAAAGTMSLCPYCFAGGCFISHYFKIVELH
jgi:hypothetical protein